MRCTEISGASAAARVVASARILPGRGASASGAAVGSVAPRQVMHTMTVDRAVGPVSLIRMAPHKLSSGCGTGANRLAAGSRTVEMNSTVAEAPRPARDQRDGRSPGSRVSASCRLPDLSHADRNQWHQASARRLQLRGQPWVGIQAPLRRWLCTTFPHRSLVRERPSKAGSTTLRPHVVNGRLPAAARQPLKRGPTAILLLSFPPPCITLAEVVRCSEPTAWGWRVKRESGECAQMACNSGAAPATVSESKAKPHVTAPRGVGRRFAGQRRSRVRRPA
jgi:hypothetical protein